MSPNNQEIRQVIVKIIKEVPAVFALIIILLLALACAMYWMPLGATLYKGESVITAEQYINLALDTHYGHSIEQQEGNSLVLTYNFKSQNEYTYLQKVNRSVPGLLEYMLNDELNYPLVIIVIFIMSLLLGLACNYQRVLSVTATRTRIYFEKIWYRNIVAPTAHQVYSDVGSIPLDSVNGLICVRSWKKNRKGELMSIVQGTKWKDNQMVSQYMPSKHGNDGLYSYILGATIKQKSSVMGIIEVNGVYKYHTDGIIRSEHCKILGLFMSLGVENLAKIISHKYNVPVYLSSDAEQGYLDWLFSKGGKEALDRNYKLLGVE